MIALAKPATSSGSATTIPPSPITSATPADCKPHKCLIRVYGRNTELIINRPRETVVFHELGDGALSHDLAYVVYGFHHRQVDWIGDDIFHEHAVNFQKIHVQLLEIGE